MYWFLPLTSGHPSCKATFRMQKRWPHKRGFTVRMRELRTRFFFGNIVSISGNIFLYPPQGHPILYKYFWCLTTIRILRIYEKWNPSKISNVDKWHWNFIYKVRLYQIFIVSVSKSILITLENGPKKPKITFYSIYTVKTKRF